MTRSRVLFVVSVLVAVVATSCQTAPPPATTAPSTTTTTTPGVEEVADGRWVCDALAAASAGSEVVVDAGVWDIGDCLVEGAGRAGVTVRARYAPGGARSTLVGMLQCSDCDGWLFSGLVVRGDAPAADPAYVVRMQRGSGWRWSQCDISNGFDADGELYGVRGVFTTTGEVRDWQLERCVVHHNGTSRPGVSDNNYDHLVYVNAFASTSPANGLIGPGNTFSHNSWGAPVKVGFGLSGGAPAGVRGVKVFSNTFTDNISPDGNCGVLVAGDSPDTVIEANTINCRALPAASSRSAIAVRQWVWGSRISIADNAVLGAHNAGLATGCGAAVSGPYDNTITVGSQLPVLGSWQVGVTGCSWNGIGTYANTTTP